MSTDTTTAAAAVPTIDGKAKTGKKKLVTKTKKTAAMAGVDHPKYSEMIRQALTALKERGGSSRQAVLKYIMKNFKLGTDESVVNTHLKLALKAGVKNASLKQSKGTGATGSFRIGNDVAAKKAGSKKSAGDKPKSQRKVSSSSKKKPAVSKPAAAKKASIEKKTTSSAAAAAAGKKKKTAAAGAAAQKVTKSTGVKGAGTKKAAKPKSSAKKPKAPAATKSAPKAKKSAIAKRPAAASVSGKKPKATGAAAKK